MYLTPVQLICIIYFVLYPIVYSLINIYYIRKEKVFYNMKEPMTIQKKTVATKEILYFLFHIVLWYLLEIGFILLFFQHVLVNLKDNFTIINFITILEENEFELLGFFIFMTLILAIVDGLFCYVETLHNNFHKQHILIVLGVYCFIVFLGIMLNDTTNIESNISNSKNSSMVQTNYVENENENENKKDNNLEVNHIYIDEILGVENGNLIYYSNKKGNKQKLNSFIYDKEKTIINIISDNEEQTLFCDKDNVALNLNLHKETLNNLFDLLGIKTNKQR